MSPRRRALGVLVALAAAALFLAQTLSNVALWLREPLMSSFTIDDSRPSSMPSVTVCPNPPFDVEALLQLGLNASASSPEELLRRVESLEGLDAPLEEVWAKAAWPLGAVIRYALVGGRRLDISPGQTTAPGWRLSFTPLGPCHTLTHDEPASVLELSIYRHPLRACDTNAVRVGYVQPCDATESLCSVSCDWEKLVNKRRNFLHTNLILHSPDDPPTLATPTSVIHLIEDYQEAALEVWVTSRQVERLGGGGEGGSSCLAAANYSQEQCHQLCVEPCHPRALARRPVHPSWNITNHRSACQGLKVTDTVQFQNLTKSHYECLGRCKPRCSERLFEYSFVNHESDKNRSLSHLSVRQSKRYQTTIQETKVSCVERK